MQLGSNMLNTEFTQKRTTDFMNLGIIITFFTTGNKGSAFSQLIPAEKDK